MSSTVDAIRCFFNDGQTCFTADRMYSSYREKFVTIFQIQNKENIVYRGSSIRKFKDVENGKYRHLLKFIK